jgi:hypothetical protein
LFNYLSTSFFRLKTIIEQEAPAAPLQRVTEVPEGETSTEEDAMDDQVKDKGKGRELGNIGEGGESGNESVDEVELKGEDGLKSQSDGEVEGEDEGGDEGGDDGEDEGEDDGENSDKEKDKESDEDMGKVEDAGNVKGASVDQDVDMVDINKVETQVATAAMANTIEVTTSEGK